MIINKISLNPILGMNKVTNKHFFKAIGNDVFVKSCSFGNTVKRDDPQSFEEFVKWADENDFLENIKDIIDYKAHIIGSGFEGTTYEIPNCDNWVVKKYRRSDLLPIANENAKMVKINDYIPELNIGQTIGTIEIPCGKNYSSVYYILKRQEGESYGVSYHDADSIDSINIKTHLSSLKKLSEFPQNSFDKCVRDIKRISAAGFEFDAANPHNIMLDDKKKNINFVDINDKDRGKSSHYGEVLFSLVGGQFAINLLDSDNVAETTKQESLEYTDTIINKFVAAMRKENVIFTHGMCFDRLLNSIILDNFLNANTTDEKIQQLKANNLFM